MTGYEILKAECIEAIIVNPIKDLTLKERLLYSLIVMYGERGCGLTNRALSKIFNISVSTVQRTLKKLVEKGYIKLLYSEDRNFRKMYAIREVKK